MKTKVTGALLLAVTIALMARLSIAREQDPQKQLEHAMGLYKRGKWEKAAKECREVLKLRPDSPGAHDLLGLALEQQGLALEQRGDSDRALAEYREVIRLQPNNDSVHYRIASVLTAKGQTDDAIAEYRTAIALNAGQAEYHFGLGLALDRKNDVHPALDEYRLAQQLDPKNRRIRLMYLGLEKELETPGLVAIDAGVKKTPSHITRPVRRHTPTPSYPAEARLARVQGTVLLAVVIGADGRIASARILSGLEPGLDRNSIETIRTWTFEPATRDGQPVPIRSVVEVSFRLF